MRARRGATRWLLLLGGLGGCGELLGLPDRTVDSHLDCSGEKCACTGGFGDCDGDANNGCESDLASDTSCGACGVTCRHASCSAGACRCQPGWEDCDGDAANGCEADLSSEATCGACGVACVNAACTGGACACNPGYGDCDKAVKTGCEVAIASDPANCGACGRDCLGGACTGGRCAAVTLTEPVPFVRGRIAVAAGLVYLTSCGIPMIPTSGGTGTLRLPVTECPEDLTIRGGNLYWADFTRIVSTPLAPGAPSVVLASGQDVWEHIAVSAAHVYWWNGSPAGELRRVPLSGGPVEALSVTSSAPSALFANASVLAWGDPQFVTMDLVTTAVTALAVVDPGAIARRILALDDAGLYWTSGSEDLHRFELATMNDKELATSAADAAELDATHVYYAYSGDGSIKRAPKDGALPEVVLATGQDFYPLTPSIAVDGEAVYWTTAGALLKIAK